jgi:sugar phosphate isomerase/epimerase
MKLAYSTLGWQQSADRAMEVIAEIGYHGIELAAQPHCLDLRSWSPQEARRLRTIAEDLGLYIAGFHVGAPDLFGEPAYEPSFMAPFQRERSARIDLVRRGIDFAEELARIMHAILSLCGRTNLVFAFLRYKACASAAGSER